MSDIAIKAEHLSKYYKLGTINSGTLRGDLQSWFARAFGKEDPHSKIGSRKYDGNAEGFWALKDLNFEIKQGDRVGIIGKNGAGKSTLLKVLSRITAPTEGDVKIRGRVASLLEVGTGFHGELTGRENIYLNGAILGMKRREVTKKLDEIIAFSEIEKYIDTPVKRYSSGMYVRLAFAVAAHLDSEILIADEVLAVGDAAFQKKALGKMNDLSTGQGRTVLFVSHNMGAVKNLCNKGIVLEKGAIVIDSDVNTALSHYKNNGISITTNDILSVHDENVKRGAGGVHFISAAFTKKSFRMDEPVELKFSVRCDEPQKGLYFSLLLKNDQGASVTTVTKECIKGIVPVGEIFSYVLTLEPSLLRVGDYPVYLWLGDEKALTQGNPDTYEVLDELIAPLQITLPKECNAVEEERLKNGYFNIDAELITLRE